MQWTFAGMDADILVERARESDADVVLELHRGVLAEREYFITEPHEFSSSVEQKAAMIRDFRRSPNCAFLVARVHGDLLGFLTVQGGALRRMRHAGKLEIMVARAARGKGVGRALMEACVDWAEKNALLRKLGLNVFADNERAIALYQAFGFEIEGRREREYRMDDGSYRDDVLMYRFV